MKKVVASLLLIGMAVSMAACGKSKSKNTFTVGFDQDFPPFGYVGDDGEYTGFDIEMATECAKRMGKEIGTMLEEQIPDFLCTFGHTVSKSGTDFKTWFAKNPEGIESIAVSFLV